MVELFRGMTPEQYMTERVDQYQKWYDGKAGSAKWWYMRMRAAAVVGAAVVPVIVNLPFAFMNYVATVVSLGVVILVSLESVLHYGDQRKNYRTTEQFLTREKMLFRTGDGPYRGLKKEAAFFAFGRAPQGQISAENSATLKVLVVAAQQPDANGTAATRKT